VRMFEMPFSHGETIQKKVMSDSDLIAAAYNLILFAVREFAVQV
jgi:hypothetical protein